MFIRFLFIWGSFFYFTQLQAKTILFMGDSLTQGYGLEKEYNYVSKIEAQIKKDGFKNIKIINASISGSTTASALPRLKWQLKNKPDILVLALGGNDGLRGIPRFEMYKNLSQTIQTALKNKIKVLLIGLEMPPNYGKKYTNYFKNVFKKLATKHQLKYFVPNLLKGVGGEAHLNQADGIHPNEKGHEKMFKNVYPTLRKML